MCVGTAEVIVGSKGHDIIFTDYGPQWDALRRVGFSAVRKYAVHDQLPSLIANEINSVIDTIKKKHVWNPFDIEPYLYLMTSNVLAQISYGQR